MNIELNKAHYPVTALGPGRRAGIWVQGCSIHCAGCASRDTWDADPRTSISIGALLAWIDGLVDAGDGLDGVTISGGEPFDQPGPMAQLLAGLRARSDDPPLDILVFSGYTRAWLRRHRAELLGSIDVLVSGPFRRDLPTRLIWRGSSNQELVMLTELARRRYGTWVSASAERPLIQVVVDDGVWLVGVPRAGDLERFERGLQRRGITLLGASWRA